MLTGLALKSWWTALLDLVYPPKCPACRQRVAQQDSWCEACLTAVLDVRVLAAPQHGLVALERVWLGYRYSGGVKRLLHNLKFHQATNHVQALCWLADYAFGGNQANLFTSLVPQDDGLAIPIPLHKRRLSERGFNQTELIFKSWCEQQGWLWQSDLLLRQRDTRPQWELAAAERRTNIKDAFLVTRPTDIRNKHILLVDDIFTSGTTLEEAARTLKAAGAASVVGLALAGGRQRGDSVSPEHQ